MAIFHDGLDDLQARQPSPEVFGQCLEQVLNDALAAIEGNRTVLADADVSRQTLELLHASQDAFARFDDRQTRIQAHALLFNLKDRFDTLLSVNGAIPAEADTFPTLLIRLAMEGQSLGNIPGVVLKDRTRQLCRDFIEPLPEGEREAACLKLAEALEAFVLHFPRPGVNIGYAQAVLRGEMARMGIDMTAIDAVANPTLQSHVDGFFSGACNIRDQNLSDTDFERFISSECDAAIEAIEAEKSHFPSARAAALGYLLPGAMDRIADTLNEAPAQREAMDKLIEAVSPRLEQRDADLRAESAQLLSAINEASALFAHQAADVADAFALKAHAALAQGGPSFESDVVAAFAGAQQDIKGSPLEVHILLNRLQTAKLEFFKVLREVDPEALAKLRSALIPIGTKIEARRDGLTNLAIAERERRAPEIAVARIRFDLAKAKAAEASAASERADKWAHRALKAEARTARVAQQLEEQAYLARRDAERAFDNELEAMTTAREGMATKTGNVLNPPERQMPTGPGQQKRTPLEDLDRLIGRLPAIGRETKEWKSSQPGQESTLSTVAVEVNAKDYSDKLRGMAQVASALIGKMPVLERKGQYLRFGYALRVATEKTPDRANVLKAAFEYCEKAMTTDGIDTASFRVLRFAPSPQ